MSDWFWQGRKDAVSPAVVEAVELLAREGRASSRTEGALAQLVGGTLDVRASHWCRGPVLDAQHRPVLIGCGVFLEQVRAELAARGRALRVELAFDPAEPDRVARVAAVAPPPPRESVVEIDHEAEGPIEEEDAGDDRITPVYYSGVPRDALMRVAAAARAAGAKLQVLGELGDEGPEPPLSSSAERVALCAAAAEDAIAAALAESPVDPRPALWGALRVALGANDDGPREWLVVGQALARVACVAREHDLAVVLPPRATMRTGLRLRRDREGDRVRCPQVYVHLGRPRARARSYPPIFDEPRAPELLPKIGWVKSR